MPLLQLNLARPPLSTARPGLASAPNTPARAPTTPSRAMVGGASSPPDLAAPATSSSDSDSSDAAAANRRALVDLTRKVGALGRSGRAAEALDTVAAAARAGRVTPDTRLATAVLDACAGAGRADLALAAFDSLFGSPPAALAPDGRAFEALARACASSDPPAWADLGKVIASMSAAGHPLTPAVFNAALGAAARTRDLDRGGAIIAQMAGAGVEPDAGTVEAVRQRKALRSLLKKAFGG